MLLLITFSGDGRLKATAGVSNDAWGVGVFFAGEIDSAAVWSLLLFVLVGTIEQDRKQTEGSTVHVDLDTCNCLFQLSTPGSLTRPNPRISRHLGSDTIQQHTWRIY